MDFGYAKCSSDVGREIGEVIYGSMVVLLIVLLLPSTSLEIYSNTCGLGKKGWRPIYNTTCSHGLAFYTVECPK